MTQHIIIIGAGPAGEAAATSLRLLSRDAEILVVEKEFAGGLCLNKGCIPSKTLLEQVKKFTDVGQSVSWAKLQEMKTNVVQNLRGQLETRLKSQKITLLKGMAKFTGSLEISVDSQGKTEKMTFDKAVIAAGTEIYYPPPLDRFKSKLLNSDSVLDLAKTPASIVIVGGGAVGCEFACLLNALGSKVTIVEMKEGLVPGEDEGIVSVLTTSFENRGIAVKTGAKVKDLQETSRGWKVTLSSGDVVEAEQVLACVGRAPAVEALGLKEAHVDTDKNKIIVNKYFQTSNVNIFAIGDVAGTRLAHHAAAQGEAAAANILGGTAECDDRFVPRCLYSWPEVASVGRWKYQAEEEGLPVKTVRAFFKGSAKALASGETEGFIQIVFEPASGRLMGAQIIGPHATELIHIFALALTHDMTLQDLRRTMFAHPTLGELIKEATKKA